MKIVVMVSGGGTNLQAIIDSVKNGQITNAEIAGVISNNKNAYALERARKNNIPARYISPKDYDSREEFNESYYGLKVHEAALARGVKVVGATVHFVDEGTDTGPIILQKAVEVQQGDTPEVLQRRVMEQAEWKILPKAIDLIANGKVRVVDNRTVLEE